MAVAGSSEKRPEWCPPGRSRHITPPRKPGSQSSSGSSSKRPNSSSSSRHSPSPTTPLSLEPPTKVRLKSSNQPSNSQYPRPRSSSPACNDGAVSQGSSPYVHGKLKEPDLELSQGTQSLPTLFSLPKDLFYVRDSGQAYELGFSSGQDVLMPGSRLAEEIETRRQLQDQLAELAVKLMKVSEDRDEAQSRANDLEQRLNSALKVQATRQASKNLEAASNLSDVRPTPANPEEFTPENYIWAKQQWDRVAKENLRLDNSLHIAGAEKHQLETEIIRLSREIKNYQKRNMGHGRSMNDAAQQTEDEPPRLATVATQTDFMDQTSQQNTENKPIELEHQALPPQQPRVAMTDAAVQAVEQRDENILFAELPDQTSKDSGALEVTIQEPTGEKERLEKQLEVCIKQNASGQDNLTQTEGTRGEGAACQTAMTHDDLHTMILRAETTQSVASRSDHENKLADQSENDVHRQENTERSAIEQPQNKNSPPKKSEFQFNKTHKEQETNIPSHTGEAERPDVEMGGIAQGPDSVTPQNTATENETPVMPVESPVRPETTTIIGIGRHKVLNNNNQDFTMNSDDTRQIRDRRRHERQMRRWQRELEREEEAHQRHHSRQEYTQTRDTLSYEISLYRERASPTRNQNGRNSRARHHRSSHEGRHFDEPRRINRQRSDRKTSRKAWIKSRHQHGDGGWRLRLSWRLFPPSKYMFPVDEGRRR